jgi:hypothetical protein
MPERLYAATLPLFGRTLGPALARYEAPVRALHTVRDATVALGSSDIRRGHGIVARVVGRVFGFPPAGRRMPTAVTIVAAHNAEIWHRRFAGHPILTHLEAAPASRRPIVRERFRFGVTFDLAVLEEDGRLAFQLAGMRVCGAPMPRFLWPVLRAEERAERGGFLFDIDIRLRGFGLLIHYHGWVRPALILRPAAPVANRHPGPTSTAGPRASQKAPFLVDPANRSAGRGDHPEPARFLILCEADHTIRRALRPWLNDQTTASRNPRWMPPRCIARNFSPIAKWA